MLDLQQAIDAQSIATSGTLDLITRPYHQASNVISVRQFTNNAFHHHHGIQSKERFGIGTDPDGDGFVNELTRADVTAATIFQITLPVPGRVIPSDPEGRRAIKNGAHKFRFSIAARPLTNTLAISSTLKPQRM